MFGWLLSILLAFFPLFDINTYKNSAICLPIATRTQAGKFSLDYLL